MDHNFTNLSDLGMSEEQLFSRIDHDSLESEKITAPRYSYWHSVFRVFFRNKLNIVILVLLAIILVFTYVYPAVIDYNPEVDPYLNLMDAEAKHLKPAAAMAKFGNGTRKLYYARKICVR